MTTTTQEVWSPDQLCARIGTASRLAYTARRQHRLLSKLAAEIGPEPTDQEQVGPWLFETDSKRDEASDAAAITIVFAAAATEGYINDLACRALGDSFVKKNLEVLNTPSKWVIIPRLVANYVIDTGGHTYELLVALTKARNEIVHPKTQDMHCLSQEQIFKLCEHAEKLHKRADDAIAALDALGKEAANFDKFIAPMWFDLARRINQASSAPRKR